MSDQSNPITSEAGHVNILLATLLASIGLILLTIGAVNGNTTLVWIGGIATAILLIVQFIMVHQEIGNLWSHIDALEKKD